MRRYTKGQIQIGETLAVLMVFLVLMIFGLYWWSSASGAQVSQERAQQQRTELIEITKTIMNMPELQCSSGGATESACVDRERALAFNDLLDDPAFSAYYRDQFLANVGEGTSYALKIADVREEEELAVFNFTTGDVNASTQTAAVPVTLYDPVTAERHFSMLLLTQEVLA